VLTRTLVRTHPTRVLGRPRAPRRGEPVGHG
jgi:hypothetical protein